MKRVVSLVLVGSILLNVGFLGAAAAVAHRRGGLPWVIRQFREAKSGRVQASNNRVDAFSCYPDSRDDIYMVGDSITSGAEWAELLGDSRVRNRGVAGDTTREIIVRLDEITAGHPRMVFIMAGINDLQGGRSASAADTLGRYRQIVERIKAESPDTRIILQSVLPVNEYKYRQYITARFPGIHMPTLGEVEALNDGIRSMGCVYVDLWPDLVTDGQLRASMTSDGLHVNGEGYRAWAARIRPLLDGE